jgi:hypothetical protein
MHSRAYTLRTQLPAGLHIPLMCLRSADTAVRVPNRVPQPPVPVAADTFVCHVCCSDSDRKYKYVSVQNFINAFANTDTAKRTQAKLATPPVINEKAEDPLVRASATSASIVCLASGLTLTVNVNMPLLTTEQAPAGCMQQLLSRGWH